MTRRMAEIRGKSRFAIKNGVNQLVRSVEQRHRAPRPSDVIRPCGKRSVVVPFGGAQVLAGGRHLPFLLGKVLRVQDPRGHDNRVGPCFFEPLKPLEHADSERAVM